MSKITSKSRRKTLWTDKETATPLQATIDSWNQNNYYRRHPRITETGEVDLINSFEVSECPHCSSSNIIKFGYTNIGIRRYRCKDCGKTFTALTNTIFDSRKISLSEWVDFLLDLFDFFSFSQTSKGNRNAYNTTKYWVDKAFLVLRGYQNDIVLKDRVYLDETYYKVRKEDIQYNSAGEEYHGLSRNYICIGVACDETNVFCRKEGLGRPRMKRTLRTFSRHIEPGSTLVHDEDLSHSMLIKKLNLKSEAYRSADLYGLPDEDNPLDKVNEKCRLLKQFLREHSGFIRNQLQDFLNLFAFTMNPPHDKHAKIEKFIIRAMTCHVLHRYRD